MQISCTPHCIPNLIRSFYPMPGWKVPLSHEKKRVMIGTRNRNCIQRILRTLTTRRGGKIRDQVWCSCVSSTRYVLYIDWRVLNGLGSSFGAFHCEFGSASFELCVWSSVVWLLHERYFGRLTFHRFSLFNGRAESEMPYWDEDLKDTSFSPLSLSN